jgi:hypothetical protein
MASGRIVGIKIYAKVLEKLCVAQGVCLYKLAFVFYVRCERIPTLAKVSMDINVVTLRPLY